MAKDRRYRTMAKRVPGFPNYYVSKDGRLFSIARDGYLAEVEPTHRRSYFVVTLLKNRKKRVQRKMHQLVLEAFVGPCPRGYQSLHKDGDGTNNNLSNLRWGTPQENHEDKRRHGTTATGSKNPSAKLTEAQVREIRVLGRTGQRHKDIAQRFEVCRSAVSRILRGEGWSHVPGPDAALTTETL